MLDKVVGVFGALFLILLMTFTSALFIGMIGQWYAIQNEAQFLAVSQGKYGGFTTQANAELQRFVSDRKLDRQRLDVQVSAAGGPVAWGQPVTAQITYQYPFKLGKLISFNVPISGKGWSVSTYLEGAYSATYTSPRW
ncbi:MAG: hypothetical protein HPY90_05570 [Syntrophothermus sp.]|uniref:hypothetical protein n=1 Tax=Syntrophothermus sp. TaxID=2736299 RepID=UPI00257E79E0|nr:hypothetical protein [Syntrophothermus sp.]NSW82733.1 hypothetical protein [Syntrophothermus sp.]